MAHGVDGLGALFSKSNFSKDNKEVKNEKNDEIIFDDFSSKMQDSYNFNKEDSELVFNILQNMDGSQIDDEE